MPSYMEEEVQNALAAFRRGDYLTLRRTSTIFNIPSSTLLDRLRKVKTRKQSHEKQQLLSTIEEEELVTWITNASKLGVPTPLPLVKNLAEEIRANRFATRSDSLDSPISSRWIDCFRARYPTLETCFTRPINASRFEGLNYSIVKSYFNSLSKAIRKEQYPPLAIFNINETSFSLGST